MACDAIICGTVVDVKNFNSNKGCSVTLDVDDGAELKVTLWFRDNNPPPAIGSEVYCRAVSDVNNYEGKKYVSWKTSQFETREISHAPAPVKPAPRAPAKPAPKPAPSEDVDDECPF